MRYLNKPLYKIINLISIGYIFFYLNFNINGFNIIGKWLSFLFFGYAVKHMQSYNNNSKLLVSLTGVLFITDFFNESVKYFNYPSVYSSYILSATATSLFLYLHFAIITDLTKVLRDMDIYTHKILIFRDVITVITTVATIIPALGLNTIFLHIITVCGVVTAFCFVVTLNKTKKLLANINKPERI